jgi:Lon-like ATP-dependent protease
VPVDLSQVLFVTTANVLDTIPGPLLDRFEIIRVAGYVHEEKMAIAKQYLIPSIKESSGVGPEDMDLGEEVVSKIITDYAREAGVRHLRKLLEKVSRKVALSMVRRKEEEKEQTAITLDNLTKYVGQPVHLSDRLYPFGTPPGVVMGLAWTSMGGASLFIEARGRLPHRAGNQQVMTSGSGKDNEHETISSGGVGGPMKVTGQLGQVMNESSEISLTYARLFVRELNPKNSFLDDAYIHLNVPEGAVPKDGPSAGVTMASALMSLALNEPIKTDLAMTGELTITGKVLPVGGIKEKVIAAKREKVNTVIMPRRNEADFRELKDYLRAGITAHFVDHYDDVYGLVFNQEAIPSLTRPSLGQPMITIEPPSENVDKDASSGKPGDVHSDIVTPPMTPEPLPSSTGVAQMDDRNSSNR